eukprot:TRINITY_DN9196_c0_g1_i2.p1 TRINITY_DN9196_c0_g1~~TRINITY_DN9196_c0_g1_i2.p1  ORF type:complete len:211 (+),score=55.10 TRINITY_DN9196_c0_g1_i2:216-848(+)
MSLDDLTNLLIVDRKAAIEQLEDEDLFETMFLSFDEMSMHNSLISLKKAVEKADYPNIKFSSHSLKGAASYIRARRVEFVAGLIQKAIENNQNELVYRYYPELIKQCILLKRVIYETLCKKEDRPLVRDDTEYDVPIAENFKLLKKANDKFDIVQVARPEAVKETKDSSLEKGDASTSQIVKEAPHKVEAPMEIKTSDNHKNTCCTCIIA